MIPKYQWLTEFGTPKCGGCDKVYLDSESPKEFQAVLPVNETNIELLDFDTNPFNLITSNDLTFDFNASTSEGQGFTIYVGTKVIRIYFTTSEPAIPGYSILNNGNLYLISIYRFGIDSDIELRLNNALVDLLDPLIGTTSSYVVGIPANYTIANIPIGSYIYVEDNLITSVATIGTSNVFLRNGFYDVTDKKLKYYNFGNPDNKFNFSIPSNLVNLNNYQLSFGYATTDSFTYTINIIDSSDVIIYTTTDTLTITDIETIVKNKFVANATDTFTIQIILEPSEENSELDFDNVSLDKLEYVTISSIKAIDCNGNENNITFTSEYNNDENYLITITGILPNVFQLLIKDSDNNEFKSITYELINGSDCTKRNLIRFKWYHDCKFVDLDYKNLPFVNDIYLQGYQVSLPIDTKESIIYALSDGTVRKVYDYSLEKTEFNIGLYTKFFYQTLQRAFKHKYLVLDGINYTQDLDSNLIKKPENDYKFSGKIELIEVGTEVIIGSCCD